MRARYSPSIDARGCDEEVGNVLAIGSEINVFPAYP